MKTTLTFHGYILFGVCGIIAQVRAFKCGKEEFKCNSNDECISNDWKCDGDEDCRDGSDEIGCSADRETVTISRPRKCDPSVSFECKNKKCFPYSYTCDYYDDCGDGSDESTTDGPLCAKTGTCPYGMFQCKTSKKCIIRQFACDGEFDCGEVENGTADNSDEENCGKDQQCIADDFKCENGRCIDKDWVCDHRDDCGDRSDEQNCNTSPCKQEPFPRFKCKESGYCIFESHRCNGFKECLDGSDEVECTNKSKSLPIVTRAPGEIIESTTIAKTTKKTSKSTASISLGTATTTTTILTTMTTSTNPPTTTRKSCGSNYITCLSDNSCVHKLWQCDGDQDCQDGSDESSEICKCQDNEFQCLNKKCIPLASKCDGHKNCDDGSDERREVCPDSANCTSETYHCKHSPKCITQDDVCNGVSNCLKGDDEGKNCGIDECDTGNGGCSHICIDTKLGHYCKCHTGYNLNSDQKSCAEINECEIPGFCSQNCVNLPGNYSCACDQGYVLRSDKKTCKALGPIPYLLISNGEHIRKLSTNFLNYYAVLNSSAKNFGKPNSLDYDVIEETVYWADEKNGTLKRARFGATAIHVLARNVRPVTVKVDWIGRKLYWLEKGSISVSDLDGTNSKIILNIMEGEVLQGLAVDPEKGHMYWSDIGDKPKVVQASLDGTNCVTMFSSSEIKMATFLTIDRRSQRLYWFDYGRDHIASSNLNRSDVRVAVNVSRYNCSLFGLTVFEDYVYWSCHHQNKINKASKFTGKIIGHFEESITGLPLDVAVYHPLMQKEVYHPCQKSNGGCSHLCFIASSHSGQVHMCDCPDHMELYSDNKTCIPKNIPKVNCNSGFVCKVTNSCISQEHVCDGIKNCIFNDDEQNCVSKSSKAMEKSKSTLYIPIVICICVLLVILVGTVLVCRHYRKRRDHLVEMSMVFQKDTEIIMDKDDLGKDYEQKYIPNDALPNCKRNLTKKNFDELRVPLHPNMDTECMVDEENSLIGDASFSDTIPIIT